MPSNPRLRTSNSEKRQLKSKPLGLAKTSTSLKVSSQKTTSALSHIHTFRSESCTKWPTCCSSRALLSTTSPSTSKPSTATKKRQNLPKATKNDCKRRLSMSLHFGPILIAFATQTYKSRWTKIYGGSTSRTTKSSRKRMASRLFSTF